MAAELNDDLERSGLPGYVLRSFKGAPKKMRLKAGFKLFVLSQRRTIGKGMVEAVNPWWSPFNPFHGDPGCNGRLEMARQMSIDPVELFKDMAAYDGKKAGGRYAVVARLSVPVWGFFGTIRRQGRANITAVSIRGVHVKSSARGRSFGYQFYIPGLVTPDHIRRAKALDLM